LKDSGFRCMAAFEGDHELLRYYSLSTSFYLMTI
jgi:hypothetical protein